MRRLKTHQAFDSYLKDYLIPTKKTFKAVYGNSSAIALWDEKKGYGVKYRRILSDKEQKCLWIFASVKKECKKYFTKKTHISPLKKKYSATVRDSQRIKKMQAGEVFFSTDINHCYWRMAFKRGYIGEKLYLKLLPKKEFELYEEYKSARNKALACIKSSNKIDVYKKGKLIRTVYEGDVRLMQMYEDIRNRAYKIMHDIKNKIGKGFIMYRVDCMYYEPQYKEIVEEHLRKCDFFFKTHECFAIDNKYYMQEGQDKSF